MVPVTGVEEDKTEASVGIDCYANSAAGFRAILKERFTDFVVNEIDMAGEVVHLTSLDPVVDNEINENQRQQRRKLNPEFTTTEAAAAAVAQEKEEAEPAKPTITLKDEERTGAAAAAGAHGEMKVIISEPDTSTAVGAKVADAAASMEDIAKRDSALNEFTRLAGVSESERLRSFLALPGVLTPAPEGCKPPQPLILGSSNDKGYRTSLHNFFSLHFQLLTDTVGPPGGVESSGPNKKESKRPHLSVRVHPKKHPRGNHGKGGGQGQKRSCENGDTDTGWGGHQRWPDGVPSYLEFILCKENKDTGDAIGILSRILHIKPKAFGFAGTKDKRGVTSQRVTLYKVRAARLAKLTLHGMKVGNFRYVDRHLGLGDLRGNNFTLTLRGVEGGTEETVAKAVKALGTSGFINYFGLQRFGTHAIPTHVIGAALLRGAWSEAIDLILKPREADRADAAAARTIYDETGDALAALKRMPHWCVAERGLLEGLVKVKGKDFVGALSGVPRTTRKLYVHAYQSYLWNRAASERVRLHGIERAVAGDLVVDKYCFAEDIAHGDDNESDDAIFSSVREVTPEEASAGVFSITDVVLPLPGSRVIYSERLKKLYDDMCKADGVQLVGFAHSVKEYSFGFLTGAYRRLLIKPDKVDFRFVRYSDPKLDLTETDLRTSRITTSEASTRVPDEPNDGKFLALRLSFALPTSSYATMALRELMKLSTSAETHSQMTRANNDEEGKEGAIR